MYKRQEYEDQKARYDQLAASYGYKEYKVVRVSFSQKWSPKALQKACLLYTSLQRDQSIWI